MYKDQDICKFCSDLQDKQVNMGGGSLIALNIATINSLIQYIANLTIGKQKYQQNEFEVMQILDASKKIQEIMLNSIDRDSEILKKILDTYNQRKIDRVAYINAFKEATDFGVFVLEKSYDTLCLVNKISKIGNTNLVSDFEIAMYYSDASVKASITNIKINLKSIDDDKYKEDTYQKCKDILSSCEILDNQINDITSKLLGSEL